MSAINIDKAKEKEKIDEGEYILIKELIEPLQINDCKIYFEYRLKPDVITVGINTGVYQNRDIEKIEAAGGYYVKRKSGEHYFDIDTKFHRIIDNRG